MRNEIITEYFRFFKKDEDYSPTDFEIERFCSVDRSYQFYDLNPKLIQEGRLRFLKTMPYLNNFNKLRVQGVNEEVFKKIAELEVFQYMKSIILIDSNGNGLFKHYKQLDKLEYFQICHGECSEKNEQVIDEEIGLLSNLKELDVISDYVKSLPSSIYNLKQLTTLYILCPVKLKSQFHRLVNLHTLGIANFNNLLDVDNLILDLNRLSSLRNLYYRNSNSTGLPNFHELMPQLEQFSLELEGQNELPEFIKYGKNLKVLSCNIGLIKIPEWITELTSLEKLTIDTFVSCELPLFLKEMKSLKIIDFSSCIDLLVQEDKKEQILKDFGHLEIIPLNKYNY